MDPDPKVRKAVMKRVRRRLKLLQKPLESSDKESSGEESSEEEEQGVFEEAQRIRRVGVRRAGVLAATAILEIRKSLVAASGQLWGHSPLLQSTSSTERCRGRRLPLRTPPTCSLRGGQQKLWICYFSG